jgi:membrane protease YdiL (CAAX protease family)
MACHGFLQRLKFAVAGALTPGKAPRATIAKALPVMATSVTDQTQPPRLATILSDFAAFLRRPQVLAPGGLRAPGNLRRWTWLTALLVAGLFGVALPFIKVWQHAFGLPTPEAFSGFPEAWLAPAVILLAPLAEELLFRGWQSGRAAALWLLGCALAGFGTLVLVTIPGLAIPAALLFLAIAVITPIGWWKLRRRTRPMAWFARGFPAIFYLAAAVFALVHLANYPQASLLAAPLVVPQLWAALVLGHIRQRIGLVAGILSHAIANASSLALAMALN